MLRTLPVLLLSSALFAQDHTAWRDYGGASDSAQYSALTQITRANVKQARSRLDLPDRRRPQVLLQSADGRRRPVRAREEQLDRRARRRHRQGNLDLCDDARAVDHHQPRHQLLGEQGRPERRLLFCANHALRAIDAQTGKAIATFGDNGARRSEGGARSRSETLTARAVDHARDASSRT